MPPKVPTFLLEKEITEFLLYSTLWVGQERGNVFQDKQLDGVGWIKQFDGDLPRKRPALTQHRTN